MALPKRLLKSGKVSTKKYKQRFRNLKRLIIGKSGQLINPATPRQTAEHPVVAPINSRGEIRLVHKGTGRIG